MDGGETIRFLQFHSFSFTLTISFMFNTLSTLVNAIQGPKIVCRSSSCVDYIIADIVAGSVRVMFSNGCTYDYKNVSRRAIFNLINNKNVSLGFFVNNVLHNDYAVGKFVYAN